MSSFHVLQYVQADHGVNRLGNLVEMIRVLEIADADAQRRPVVKARLQARDVFWIDVAGNVHIAPARQVHCQIPDAGSKLKHILPHKWCNSGGHPSVETRGLRKRVQNLRLVKLSFVTRSEIPVNITG
jgi:hypothetical protein